MRIFGKSMALFWFAMGVAWVCGVIPNGVLMFWLFIHTIHYWLLVGIGAFDKKDNVV